MLTYKERITVRNTVITGYNIARIAFGPSHGSNCVSYRNYDARFHEISHSVHSLYHEDTLRIYGKYLGRFPEEIMFHPGDIVEVPVRLGDDDTAYYTLGIVMESPKTVEQMYRPNLDVFEDDITEIGDDYYRICFAPLGANDCIRFIPTGEVYPRAFGVPEEARTCLMQYRDEVQKVKDDIKNICRKKNPRVNVELVVVGEPVELAPIPVKMSEAVTTYSNWIESGKNAVGATIYRCGFRESATAVDTLIQNLKKQLHNHVVYFRVSHQWFGPELSDGILAEAYTDDIDGKYFPENYFYSYEMDAAGFADTKEDVVDQINADIRRHNIMAMARNGEDFPLLSKEDSDDELTEVKVVRVNSFSEIHWATNLK
jgi:hypothetical protein